MSIIAIKRTLLTGASAKGGFCKRGLLQKGASARLEEPPVEGKLMGRALRVKVGQQIRVKLINLDPYKGYVDFAIVEN
ncbi:MAG: hypothetical protein V1822_03730 [Candidatus Micrarchaeota archaeon]